MWVTEHSSVSSLPSSSLWTAFREVHTGAVTAPGGDIFELHGPFEVGTELSVTPQGQDTFRSEIIELVENERYADRTSFGEVTLTFRHTFEPLDGGTKVTHQLVIDGPGADKIAPELGPQISDDFPAAMRSLFEIAAQPVAG
jgi:hypothetical protein